MDLEIPNSFSSGSSAKDKPTPATFVRLDPQRPTIMSKVAIRIPDPHARILRTLKAFQAAEREDPYDDTDQRVFLGLQLGKD